MPIKININNSEWCKFLRIILVLLLFTFTPRLAVYGQATLLYSKTWSYKTLAIVSQGDTLVLFSADSTKSLWYLGKVNFVFNSNGTYTGTNTEGNTRQGTWSMPNDQTIIVDKDTTKILAFNGTQLRLNSEMRYQDDSLNLTGTLLMELYPTPPIISLCNSLQSGDWSASTTWSCGHEPTITDVVIINPNHIIAVSTSTAQAQRIIYHGGVIKFSTLESKIFVKGSD